RRRDNVPMARNLETFARCRSLLARGGTIALFPEGSSHNEPAPLPLKTGAARIALEAEDEHGPLGMRVVPVGLVYEDKERFRSRGWRAFTARRAELERSDPERALRMAAALRAYEEARRSLGLRETDLATPERAGHRRLRGALEWIGLLPGAVLNWVPYRLPAW